MFILLCCRWFWFYVPVSFCMEEYFFMEAVCFQFMSRVLGVGELSLSACLRGRE